MVRAVLFDLDRTLLDFDRAQRGALRRALLGLGLPFSPRILARYREINDLLWAAYRRGEVSQAVLEVERFRRLLSALGTRESRAGVLSRVFLASLSARGDRLPGCHRLLTSLRPRFRMGVVTNGIDRVQQARLRASRLRPFFEVVVTSEGCGYAKPDPRILRAALDALEVTAREAIYVGDDLAVDGVAARAAGVPFVWVDHGDPRSQAHRPPRRRVESLRELLRHFAL